MDGIEHYHTATCLLHQIEILAKAEFIATNHISDSRSPEKAQ